MKVRINAHLELDRGVTEVWITTYDQDGKYSECYSTHNKEVIAAVHDVLMAAGVDVMTDLVDPEPTSRTSPSRHTEE